MQRKEAELGILFVDQAYRLIPMQKSDDKDYGLEALEEIMLVMDNGKVVVILTGYSESMKQVITSNEGFCRLVTKFFTFDDFMTEDLAKILHLKMNNQTEGIKQRYKSRARMKSRFVHKVMRDPNGASKG
ncbi:putative P-loop containing nucleoside triphosphate hydrolase [Helianthus debilis subsp. tardiflorus]